MAANGRRPENSPATQQTAAPGGQDYGDRYRWVALANTTAAMFMATLDGSIVIIALPAIFRGIHLDPLAAGNISTACIRFPGLAARAGGRPSSAARAPPG